MEQKQLSPQQAVETICYHALSKSGLTAQAYDEIQSTRAGLLAFLAENLKPKEQPTENVLNG